MTNQAFSLQAGSMFFDVPFNMIFDTEGKLQTSQACFTAIKEFWFFSQRRRIHESSI